MTGHSILPCPLSHPSYINPVPSKKPYHSWLNGVRTLRSSCHYATVKLGRGSWERPSARLRQIEILFLPCTKWNLEAGAQRLKLGPKGRGVNWAVKPISHLTASPQHQILRMSLQYSPFMRLWDVSHLPTKTTTKTTHWGHEGEGISGHQPTLSSTDRMTEAGSGKMRSGTPGYSKSFLIRCCILLKAEILNP